MLCNINKVDKDVTYTYKFTQKRLQPITGTIPFTSLVITMHTSPNLRFDSPPAIA